MDREVGRSKLATSALGNDCSMSFLQLLWPATLIPLFWHDFCPLTNYSGNNSLLLLALLTLEAMLAIQTYATEEEARVGAARE